MQSLLHLPVDQRRYDYVRLLRQVPVIHSPDPARQKGPRTTARRQTDLSMDVVGSDTDRSADPAFIGAKAKEALLTVRVYFSKGKRTLHDDGD